MVGLTAIAGDKELTCTCPQVRESLDQNPAAGGPEMSVPRIANRGELARRLLGTGRRYTPERNAVAELIAERAEEG